MQKDLNCVTQKGFESDIVCCQRFGEVSVECVYVLIVAEECGGEG